MSENGPDIVIPLADLIWQLGGAILTASIAVQYAYHKWTFGKIKSARTEAKEFRKETRNNIKGVHQRLDSILELGIISRGADRRKRCDLTEHNRREDDQ